MRRLSISLALLMVAMASAQAPAGSVYGWLRAYARHHARDVAQDPLFSAMVQLTVPRMGLYMGRSRTLAADFTMEMHNSSHRVELRQDRYLEFSGYRNDGGVSQSFFWADLQQDQAFGAIYVCLGPSGSCNQQLWVFSNRQPTPIRNMSQLPAAFNSSLANWQAKRRLPGVMLQYFIGPSGRNLLLHEPANCAVVDAKDAERCHSANRTASELDLHAAWNITSAHASLDHQLLQAEREEGAWFSRRNTTCAASPDPDCYSRVNERRAAALLAAVQPRPPFSAAQRMPAGPALAPQSRCLRRTPIYEPEPVYTDAARQAHVSERLQATLQITPAGRATDIVVEDPAGVGLGTAAAAALERWRWAPLPRRCPQQNTKASVMFTFRPF